MDLILLIKPLALQISKIEAALDSRILKHKTKFWFSKKMHIMSQLPTPLKDH